MMGRRHTPDLLSSNLLAYPFAEPTRPRRNPRRKKNAPESKSLTSSKENVTSNNSYSPQSERVKSGFRASIQERRTKTILFYRNGDRFFKGKRVRITPNRYLTFNELLNDLTKSVSLPYGVRKIYTPKGDVVANIDGLEDGKAYVCASFERFKELTYGQTALPDWSSNTKKPAPLEDKVSRLSFGYTYPPTGKYASSYSKAAPPGGRSLPGTFAYQKGGQGDATARVIGRPSDAHSFKPRLVKFIKYGSRPRKVISILLNRRTVFSFEHLLNEITDAFDLSVHRNQRIRKLYTTKGREIRGVSDFFRETDSFFIAAINRQPLLKVEIQDILEEIFPANSPESIPENPPSKPRRKFKDRDSKSDSGVEVDLPGDTPTKSASAELPPLKNSKKNKKDSLEESPEAEPKIKVKAWASQQEREEEEKRIKAEEKRRREEAAQRKKEAERKAKEEGQRRKQEELWKLEEEKERRKQAEALQAELARKDAELKKKEEELRRKEEESKRKEEERKRNEEKRRKDKKRKEEEERKKKEEEKREEEEKIMKEKERKQEEERKKKEEEERKEEEDREKKRKEEEEKKKLKEHIRKEEERRKKEEEKKQEDERRGKEENRRKGEEDKKEDIINKLVEEKQKAPEQEPESENSMESDSLEETVRRPKAKSDDDDNDSRFDLPAEDSLVLSEQKSQVHETKGTFTGDDELESKTDDGKELDENRFAPAPREIVSKNVVLQRYEVGKKIGDGNFAEVHKATQKSSGETFAMKIVYKSKLNGKEHMIANEIGIMHNINHENIVRLYEEYETKNHIYLLMEYVAGGDLFDAITESIKFTEADGAQIIGDMAKALKYLHDLNVVHRDLKPENLLVSKTSSGDIMVKLADFGLAMEVLQPIYTVCGTPTYVAPEILAETGYGLEVDMWATGVITYILLCGFPPFRSLDRDQEELFELIQAGQFEFLSPYWDNISFDAKDLINHLLVVNPRRRFKAEQIIRHPWIVNHNKSADLPNLQREVSINLERNFEGRKSAKSRAAETEY